MTILVETPEVANVKRTPAPIRKRNAESDHRNAKAPKQKRLTGTPVIRLENQDSDDPFRFLCCFLTYKVFLALIKMRTSILSR